MSLAVAKPVPGPAKVWAVVVVVTDTRASSDSKQSLVKSDKLKRLTLAATALPGLLAAPLLYAEDEEGAFNYSYYQEGKRNLYGLPNSMQPIRVDTLNSTGHIQLSAFDQLHFNYIQDSWSGATPITSAPRGFMIEGLSGASSHVNTGKAILVDQHFRPLKRDYPDGEHLAYIQNPSQNQMVDMLTSASPETRKQADLRYSHDWTNSSANFAGGISAEPDYQSYFLNSGFKKDFNQKLTSLTAGLGFTDSDINALKMPSAQGYIDYGSYAGKNANIAASRQDWSGHLGVSQVLDKASYVSADLSFTHSHGFLSNPYKVSTFIFKDPEQTHIFYPDDVFKAELTSILEKRPEERNQFAWSTRYVRYFEKLEGALHFNYGFSDDNWGILSHTFALQWDQSLPNAWTLTPSIRYYSQDAAEFYQPIFYVDEAKPVKAQSANVDISKLPFSYFSSDHRLSGFGALSGGINLTKKLAKGVTFKAGFEYYTHKGGWKLGGGGENAYADFDYYMINAGLKVNLSALTSALNGSSEHSHHHHHHNDAAFAPAGLMFDHILHAAGDWMFGYRYMYGDQSGHTLNGASQVSDSQILSQACNGTQCQLTPSYMHMHMHMLDLMYAPTDWMTVMLMPQFMDMNMLQRPVAGSDSDEFHKHRTAGVGDTGVYGLFKLYRDDTHQLHTSLGISAPTGDVGIKMNPGHHGGAVAGFLHYGMQLGSGTWDFKPSLTYNAKQADWFWGAQAAATIRMQDQNRSGYALGNEAQVSLWTGYSLTQWMSTTIRGLYTAQGAVQNQFNAAHQTNSTADYPFNYGGRFADIGFGLNILIPEKSGALSGHRLGVEWLQPVSTDFNGYQVDRNGGLSANWGFAF